MTSAVCVLIRHSNVATGGLGEYYGQAVRSLRDAVRLLPAHGLSSKRPSLSVVTQKTAPTGVSLIGKTLWT
jgi:hypothetical protein